ncbi:hypothetical protein AB3Y40_12130 [Yoonia sp. R2331]|uniref:hypothetical protein n=1 Tax=Yoonia sp. R2331 TaxID=3237238 RepID=UPI0034E50C4F
MKTISVITAVLAVVAVGLGIYLVDIEQTEEAALPDVDVSVEGGNLPAFDAEVGDVDVGTEEITLDVPTIDLQSPEEQASEDS